MNEKCNKIGRIAMGVALADTIKPKHSNSRMANLCRKLRQRCEWKLSFMRATKKEREQILENIELFKKETGWDKGGRRLETFAAFVLALLDKDDNVQGIIEAINDIVNFLEQTEKTPDACNWSGALAFEKWSKIWEKGLDV